MSGSSGLVCVWHSDARRVSSVWLDRSARAGHWLTVARLLHAAVNMPAVGRICQTGWAGRARDSRTKCC
jgi:hypothetical protein